MTHKLYKAGAFISTVALLANSFVGLAAAEVVGTGVNNTTGADSTNEVKIDLDQTTFVDQNNYGSVVNDINLNANTGGNSASKNTGEGHVTTGDIATGVGVSNLLNRNVADVEACGGCDFDILAANEKTGADSENKAKVEVDKTTTVQQDNTAYIRNYINQDLNTGDNKANKNTGMGSISTGDVESVSLVENAANKNWANIRGGQGGALLTATNDTTGFDSENKAKIDVDLINWMAQDNHAYITNDADITVNTGRNKANKNTGEGEIETGDIGTGIGFETAANANFLAFDACCDVELGVGNFKTGAESENKSKAELDSTNTVFQSNCESEPWWELSILDWESNHECGVTNLVHGDLNTGENKTNKNTADGVLSGDVEAAVEVSTDENHNLIGSDLPDVEWSDFGWWAN